MALPVITRMWKLHKQLAWAIAANHSEDFFHCRDQVRYLYQGSKAVQDINIMHNINQVLDTKSWQNSMHLDRFKTDFAPWLLQHSSNSVIGLDQYCANFSAGTTQAFDSFYFRWRERRFRCFVGEYFYHIKTWINNNVNWSFVTEQDPLTASDALIISMPFCDTGSAPADYQAIIDQCTALNIPVLVDACYYVISGGIKLDVSAKCIDTVAFSLSKAFPVGNLRIGIRYTRPSTADGQSLHDSINYNNTMSAQIGSMLIDTYSSDYVYNKYRQQQLEFCNAVNLDASNCVLFAVGNDSWNEYNRRNLLQQYQLSFDPNLFANRISLTHVFENWPLFELLKNETTVSI